MKNLKTFEAFINEAFETRSTGKPRVGFTQSIIGDVVRESVNEGNLNEEDWMDGKLSESVSEAFTKKDWDVKWKMPKDNLFNTTKTKNAVDDRYKALQNLLKDKPKELKAFDATDDHPAYDMSYDELMKWYNNLSESVSEAASAISMPEAEKVWDALVKKFSDNKNDSIEYLNKDKSYRNMAIMAILEQQNFKRYIVKQT